MDANGGEVLSYYNMDDQQVPGRSYAASEVASLFEERDRLHHLLEEKRITIENLTMEVQRLVSLFQVRIVCVCN